MLAAHDGFYRVDPGHRPRPRSSRTSKADRARQPHERRLRRRARPILGRARWAWAARRERGSLYRLDPGRHACTRHADARARSPTASTGVRTAGSMYYADTAHRAASIVFDFDDETRHDQQPAAVRRRFPTHDGLSRRPRRRCRRLRLGRAVGGRRRASYAPDGRLDVIVPMPASLDDEVRVRRTGSDRSVHHDGVDRVSTRPARARSRSPAGCFGAARRARPGRAPVCGLTDERASSSTTSTSRSAPCARCAA